MDVGGILGLVRVVRAGSRRRHHRSIGGDWFRLSVSLHGNAMLQLGCGVEVCLKFGSANRAMAARVMDRFSH
jgi:hypothetical protein